MENQINQNMIWWIGKVEDRSDPLNMGRCRVRIFGTHSDDLTRIPTQSLPWAVPIRPANDSRKAATPMMGEYVAGFFLDGENRQMPAIIGTFPSLPQQPSNKRTNTGVIEQPDKSEVAKYISAGSQVKQSEDPQPQPPAAAGENMPVVRYNKPTTPSMSYEYIGTIIEKSNNNLAHACDSIKGPLFEEGKKLIKEIIDFIAERAGLKALSKGLSTSAFGQWIAELIKAVKRVIELINMIMKWIKIIMDWIMGFINYISALISWITTLPQQLANIARNCLVQLLSDLFDAGTGTVSSNFGSELNSITGLFSTINTAINAGGQLIQNIGGFTEVLTELPDAFSEKTLIKP